MGSGIGHAAEKTWNDPVGTGKAVVDWAGDGLKGLWTGVSDAYSKGGVSQAGGHVAAAAVSLVNPFKKAQKLGDAAEALDDMGDLARAEKRAATPKRKDEQPHKAEEDGKDGARVTRVHKVECFDVPDKLKQDPKKLAEYKRQLDEQMKYINENMTADDMAYAHWVLEKAGGTKSLRQPYKQTQHRRDYKQYRLSQGITEEEIDMEMTEKAATHFLDMIAGGHPAVFSKDAAGNPVLGDSEVNSDIGNRWTQKDRASSLRTAAEDMRKQGKSAEKMNVQLNICE